MLNTKDKRFETACEKDENSLLIYHDRSKTDFLTETLSLHPNVKLLADNNFHCKVPVLQRLANIALSLKYYSNN